MLLRTLSQGTLGVGLDRVGEDQSNRVVPLLRRSLWIGDWEGPCRRVQTWSIVYGWTLREIEMRLDVQSLIIALE